MPLFKYLPPDRIDVIERARIRFSPPQAFNDPFDMKPGFRGVASRERWDSHISEILPSTVEKVYSELPERSRQLLPLPILQALLKEQLSGLQGASFGIAELM